MKRISVVSAMLAMAAGVGTIATASPSIDYTSGDNNARMQTAAQGESKTRAISAPSAFRLTSTQRAGRYWLLPVPKQTFKQNRRKELAKTRRKKAKK